MWTHTLIKTFEHIQRDGRMDVDNVSLIADAKVNLERTLGLFSNSKRLESGDGSSQNQSVNVMSAFICVDGL